MRYVLSIFLLLVSSLVFGTKQISDLIIVNKDTLLLYNFPLEEIRPVEIKEKLELFIRRYDNLCSACNKGYRAIWELKGDSLYLNEITECCFNQKYWITARNILVLRKAGVPEDILEFLQFNGNYKGYWDFELKRMMSRKFKRKYVNKYLPTIFMYTEVFEKKISAGLLMKDNPHEGKIFASWYSGILYFEMRSVMYMLNTKSGVIVDKNAY